MEGQGSGEGSGQGWQSPGGQQGGQAAQAQQPQGQQQAGYGQQPPSGPLLSDHQKQNMLEMGPKILAGLGGVLAIGAIIIYADMADFLEFGGHLTWWTMWASGVVTLGLGAVSEAGTLLTRLVTVLLGFLIIVGTMGGGIFGVGFI